MSHFFAYLSRMKLIQRWALMQNIRYENVQEHSLQVAMIAHALGVIGNQYFERKLNAERLALFGIFHDSTEVFTGDMPTPAKYFSPEIRDAYRKLETEAGKKLLSFLPSDLRNTYRPLIEPQNGDEQLWTIIKAADNICAYLKCLEEIAAGNREFNRAKIAIGNPMPVRFLSLRRKRTRIFYDRMRHRPPGFMPEPGSGQRTRLMTLTKPKVAAVWGALFCFATGAFGEPEFESEFCKAGKDRPTSAEILRGEVSVPAAKFGLGLYRLVTADQPGNFVLSPFSMTSTASMALAGARGETANEMAAALALKGVPTGEALHRQADFLRRLNCGGQWRKTRIYTANRIYLAIGKKLNAGYVKTLKDSYDATVGEVDFKKHPDAARKEINAWVEQATAGKIKDLIAPQMLTADTRMTLVNALYLKGRWATAFDKQATKPGTFHVDGKKAQKVAMMAVKSGEDSLSYAALPGYRVVGLPLNDNAAAFAIFIPDRVDGEAKLEADMTGDKILSAIGELKHHRLNLSLPKFKIEGGFEAKKALMALGMKRAFGAKTADFSGIDDGKDQLFVGGVTQKAFLSVNEDGLEGAAATAMIMSAGGVPPKPTRPIEVKVDRPFFFVVYETESLTPLFLGRVTNPQP
jgi:serpin B